MSRSGGLRPGLETLMAAGLVDHYDGGTEPVWSINPGRLHVAAFYRNGVVHHFVNRSIIELALLEVLRRGETEDLAGDAMDAAMRLRDLLKFEFFFREKEQFRAQLVGEMQFIHPHWRELLATGADAAALLDGSTLLVAHRTLRSFVDAQLVVAERLVALAPRTAVDRRAFVQECMAVGHQLVLQGHLHSDAAVSRESFHAALDLAANRDLLDPGGAEVHEGREAWLAEIREVLVGLEQVRAADNAALTEVLHGTV
jgi:glycerol-3-phosphate O-acyltransferase